MLANLLILYHKKAVLIRLQFNQVFGASIFPYITLCLDFCLILVNFQGRLLKNDERTSITSGDGVSCLLLQDITTDDSGKYDVSLENMFGADYSYASVSVEGNEFSSSFFILDLSNNNNNKLIYGSYSKR